MENFLPIPNFPDYRIGDKGTVLSRKIRGSRHGRLGDWKPIKFKVTRFGYRCVNLYREKNRPERYHCHKLVAMVWIGDCPDGMEVRHLDGNKLNNDVANLRYGTRLENMADKNVHGTQPFGEKMRNAKMTNDQIREIKALIRQGLPPRVIAKKFGVTRHWVSKVKGGEIWSRIA